MAQIIMINSLDPEELQIYKSCNEAQLLHYFEPNGGLFIAESPMVVERALDAGYKPYSMLLDEALLKKQGSMEDDRIGSLIERCGDIPVYCGPESLLGRLTGFKLTRGILCAMYRMPLSCLDDTCRNAHRIAVLDGVENPANVGSIFRNAAAFGIDAVLLTSDCSDPLYRRSLRVSMGTSLILPWTIIETSAAVDYTGFLHSFGFTAAALALRENSLRPDDKKIRQADKLALVLGNEGFGLPDDVISRCDHTVMIPMQNGVDSLNVAAASAVAFWELRKR